MKIRFKKMDVALIVEHVEQSKEHATLYDEKTGPGLWLVGDHGVYLMSNGKPSQPNIAKGGDSRFVVYAEGINPDVDEFDVWWENKRTSFGGDDGVDFLKLTDVVNATRQTKGPYIKIDLTPDKMTLYGGRAA